MTRRSVYWFMWVLTELFFAYQFILRVSPGIIMHDLMHKFQINATSFGVLSALFYISYASMQVPIGILLDKYGPRLIVAASSLICVLGNLTFIYSDLWLVALLGRLLIGVGSVAGFLGASKTVSMLCTPKQLTYMMSLTFTIGYLGAISGRPVTMFVERFGWENVLLVISFIGMLIAAGLLLLNAPYQNENTHQKTSNAGLMTILKKPQVILVCICGALQIGPLEAFADIWGINYFVKVHSINKVEASTLTSAIYVGLCLGGPLIAYLAEKSQRYYETCALCGLAMMGLFILLLSGIKLNFTMILLMMLLIGIFSGYQIIVFSITSQAVSISLNGVATSVTNMIIMSAGFVFHFIIGRLMDYYSDGTISNGIHVYGAEAYTKSIIIIPVTLFIGFTGFFLLKPKVKSF